MLSTPAAARSDRLRSPVASMALGTAVSRITGYVRTSVWAAALGLNLVGSAFLVANTVPNVLFVLLVGGALNSVLVPAWVQAAQLPDEQARERTDKLLSAVVFGLLAITVAATAAAPAIARLYAGPTWDDADVALATSFARWCLPQIFFYGLYSALGQLLNSRGRFGPMMWSPVLNNVVVTAVGVAFLTVTAVDTTARSADEAGVTAWQIHVLGLGATTGIALQALVLLWPLWRSGFRFTPRFDLRAAGLRRVFRAATWTALFVLVNQVAYLVTTVVANSASKSPDAAGMPTYSNAYLLLLLPHGVVAVAIATAGLPAMTRAVSTGRAAEAHGRLAADMRTVGTIAILSTGLFIVGAAAGTRIAFAGNAPNEARLIGIVLIAFAPALPFFSLQYLLLRGFYAHEDTRTPALLQTWIAAVNITTTVAAAAVLPARYVVPAMAAGYSLSYAVGFLATARAFVRRHGDPGFRVLAHQLGGVAVVAAPAAAAGWLVQAAVHQRCGPGVADAALALAAGIGAFLAVAMLVDRLTGRRVHSWALAIPGLTKGTNRPYVP